MPAGGLQLLVELRLERAGSGARGADRGHRDCLLGEFDGIGRAGGSGLGVERKRAGCGIGHFSGRGHRRQLELGVLRHIGSVEPGSGLQYQHSARGNFTDLADRIHRQYACRRGCALDVGIHCAARLSRCHHAEPQHCDRRQRHHAYCQVP